MALTQPLMPACSKRLLSKYIPDVARSLMGIFQGMADPDTGSVRPLSSSLWSPDDWLVRAFAWV